MKTEMSTSDTILDLAQTLIEKGGYNGFSYADIAAAIGIRKASIHHHFPTKAALVCALVARYRQQVRDGLASLAAHVDNPVGQVQAYLDYWQKCILDASAPFCVCAMLASEMQMLPDEVAAGVRAHFEDLSVWLASVLRAGAAQQLFRLNGSPDEEAQILMAVVHGAMLSARAFGNPNLFHAIVNPQVTKLRRRGQI